jgi:hypothetical protein
MDTHRWGAARFDILVLVFACLALVAACSGSAGATTVPAGSTPAGAVPAGTTAPVASSGGASPAGPGAAGCAAVMEAAATISIEMQLLYQAGSADQWEAMTASTAPIALSGDRFAAAVEVLATAPGAAELAAKYMEIAGLEKAATTSSDPWGGGSGPGARVQQKVQATFIDLGVALSTLLESLGC